MITEHHALLEQYLADLDRRLAGADPGERADIVASVREHVEDGLTSLGRPATAADVAAALESLGSVDSVIRAWAPDAVTPDPRPARTPGIVLAAGVLAGLSVLVLPLAGVIGLAAVVVGAVALRRRAEPRWVPLTAVVVGAVSAVIGIVLVLGPLAWVTLHSVPVGEPAPPTLEQSTG